MYKVELDNFEGPLDVLLHLIQKMEIDIHNIKIAQLTDGYLKYIDSIDTISLENAEEYIVMASTLIHLKSKRLLPKDEIEQDNVIEEELVQRLIDYKNYKDMQDVFYGLQEDRANFGDKEATDFPVESKLMNMSSERLKLAFKNLLSNKKLEIQAEESIKYRKEISLESIRNNLQEIFINNETIRFEIIFEDYESRQEIVAVFICLLDMVKEGKLDIDDKLNIKYIE